MTGLITTSLLNLIFSFGKVMDSSVAYAGSNVNGATVQIKSVPSRLRLKLTCVGGTFASNNVVGTLQTSPDGATWFATAVAITFTSSTTLEAEITVPIMQYVRIAYSGAASGFITAIMLLNNDPDQVVGNPQHDVEDPNPINGFLFCPVVSALDTLLSVPANAGGTAYLIQDDQLHAGFITCQVTSVTTGNVTAKLQYSLDGGSSWLDSGDTGSAQSTNATIIFQIVRGLGKRIRLFFTVASSFNGKVTTQLVGDGSLQAVA